jgi:hypothetical protein
MAPGAVVSPLTGENLVPQGARRVPNATEPPQQTITKPLKQQLYAKLEIGFTRMDQLAEVAQLMLQIAQSNLKDTLDDSLFTGFIRRIKEFASSQSERTESLADIKRLLEGVQQDIAVVRTQTTQSISSATMGLSYDSAT